VTYVASLIIKIDTRILVCARCSRGPGRSANSPPIWSRNGSLVSRTPTHLGVNPQKRERVMACVRVPELLEDLEVLGSRKVVVWAPGSTNCFTATSWPLFWPALIVIVRRGSVVVLELRHDIGAWRGECLS
jgi:hypothetical protein